MPSDSAARFADAPWQECKDPAILRSDANWNDRQAQLYAERANDLREKSDRHTAIAEAQRALAEVREQEVRDA